MPNIYGWLHTSSSEQDPRSVIHPFFVKVFLISWSMGPHWFNLKADPEKYGSCDLKELFVINVAHQLYEKKLIIKTCHSSYAIIILLKKRKIDILAAQNIEDKLFKREKK